MTSPVPTEHQAPRTIGDVLLQLGFAGADEIARASEVHERTGQPLGQILVEAGAITRLELASALAEQWSGPGVSSGPPPGPPPHGAVADLAGCVGEADPLLVDQRHGAAASADPDALQALDSRVSALAARLEATLGRMTGLEATLDATQGRLEKLNEGADRRQRELESPRREELGPVARRAAGEPALVLRIDELAAAVDGLVERPAADPAMAGRIAELEARLGAAGGALEDLRSRVDSAPAPAGGATSRLAATPEGVEGDLERVRLATKRLGLHVEAHDRALAELMRSRGVAQRLDELSARIDDLAATGSLAASPAQGGRSADAIAELRALNCRIEQAESTLESEREKLLTRVERMASSIDWRLRRLEAGAGGTSRP